MSLTTIQPPNFLLQPHHHRYTAIIATGCQETTIIEGETAIIAGQQETTIIKGETAIITGYQETAIIAEETAIVAG